MNDTTTWHDPDEEVTTEVRTLGTIQLSEAAIAERRACVSEVADMFVEFGVSVVLVVDNESSLCGLVTHGDIVKCLDSPATPVEDVMSTQIVSLSTESSVACAAALMSTEGITHIVVTDRRGGCAGVVSALDIARYVAERAGYLTA